MTTSPRFLTRRLLLSAAITTLTLASLVSASPIVAQRAGPDATGPTMRHASKLTKLIIAVRPNSTNIPVYLCVSSGICAKHGIDLQLQTFLGTSADMAAAMQGGSVDLGVPAITDVLQARQQGFDQVIVAYNAIESPHNPSGPSNGLLVKDPSIKTGKDLEGKTVAVLGLQSASQLTVMAWVRKTGGDPSKVKWVGTIPQTQYAQAIAKGTVDAAQAPEPYRTIGIAAGERSINMYTEIRPQGLGIGTIAAKGSNIAGRPQVFKQLVAALQESSDLANSNQALAKATLKAVSPLDPTLIDQSNLPLFTARVSIGNTNFWKATLNRFFNSGITVNPYDAIWSGALPEPAPAIKFTHPAKVAHPSVTFNVSVQNLKLALGNIGKANVFDHGYIQFVMDGGKYDTPRYAEPNSKLTVKTHRYSPASEPYMTYRHLPRGKHTLVARLANNDGSPMGVSASIRFVVK